MANVAYPFRITDNSNNLVPGATIVIGSTTLTEGVQAYVTALGLSTGASLNSGGSPAGVPVTYVDFGSGDYVLIVDPEPFGEAYFEIAVSKSGSTITGANATRALIATKDSSRIIVALPNVGAGTSGGLPLGDGSGRVLLQPGTAPPDSVSIPLLLGMAGHNVGTRNMIVSGGVLTQFDICYYDTAAHAAQNDGATGLLHQWTTHLLYSGGVQTSQYNQQIA